LESQVIHSKQLSVFTSSTDMSPVEWSAFSNSAFTGVLSCWKLESYRHHKIRHWLPTTACLIQVPQDLFFFLLNIPPPPPQVTSNGIFWLQVATGQLYLGHLGATTYHVTSARPQLSELSGSAISFLHLSVIHLNTTYPKPVNSTCNFKEMER
jgi:hypothetical protein